MIKTAVIFSTGFFLLATHSWAGDAIELYCEGESVFHVPGQPDADLGSIRVLLTADRSEATVLSSNFRPDTFPVSVNGISYQYTGWPDEEDKVSRSFSLNRNTLSVSYRKSLTEHLRYTFDGTCVIYDPKI